jgi:hypothetical protein
VADDVFAPKAAICLLDSPPEESGFELSVPLQNPEDEAAIKWAIIHKSVTIYPSQEGEMDHAPILKKLLISAMIALAGSAWAQDAHKVVRVEDVTWVDHPVFKGAKTAILVGDPTKAEVIVQRVKFPPNYRYASGLPTARF